MWIFRVCETFWSFITRERNLKATEFSARANSLQKECRHRGLPLSTLYSSLQDGLISKASLTNASFKSRNTHFAHTKWNEHRFKRSVPCCEIHWRNSRMPERTRETYHFQVLSFYNKLFGRNEFYFTFQTVSTTKFVLHNTQSYLRTISSCQSSGISVGVAAVDRTL